MASSRRQKMCCRLKAMIDIITAAQMHRAHNKNDPAIYGGPFNKSLSLCLFKLCSAKREIPSEWYLHQQTTKSTRLKNLRNINLHDRQLCQLLLQEIGFDCCLIFTWNLGNIALVFIIFYGDSDAGFAFYPRGGRFRSFSKGNAADLLAAHQIVQFPFHKPRN